MSLNGPSNVCALSGAELRQGDLAAFNGMLDNQSGRGCEIVSGSEFNRLICLTTKKVANATMMKPITVFKIAIS